MYTLLITLHHNYNCNYTTLITPHYNYNSTTLPYNYNYNCATPHYIQQLWVSWPLQPLQPLQKTQLKPPFGASVDSLCHPWVTTTNLSYRFPIFETSATALCGTTGLFNYNPLMSYNWLVIHVSTISMGHSYLVITRPGCHLKMVRRRSIPSWWRAQHTIPSRGWCSLGGTRVRKVETGKASGFTPYLGPK